MPSFDTYPPSDIRSNRRLVFFHALITDPPKKSSTDSHKTPGPSFAIFNDFGNVTGRFDGSAKARSGCVHRIENYLVEFYWLILNRECKCKEVMELNILLSAFHMATSRPPHCFGSYSHRLEVCFTWVLIMEQLGLSKIRRNFLFHAVRKKLPIWQSRALNLRQCNDWKRLKVIILAST